MHGCFVMISVLRDVIRPQRWNAQAGKWRHCADCTTFTQTSFFTLSIRTVVNQQCTVQLSWLELIDFSVAQQCRFTSIANVMCLWLDFTLAKLMAFFSTSFRHAWPRFCHASLGFCIQIAWRQLRSQKWRARQCWFWLKVIHVVPTHEFPDSGAF